MTEQFRTGYVALIGKPNTGKSTLMNAIVGEKLSITAHRPQTTRHQILGIKTTAHYQCIFMDTPGIHRSGRQKAIHRYMNRAATSLLVDVDLVCLVVNVCYFNEEDAKILNRFGQHANTLIVLNKIDQLRKPACLPVIKRISAHAPDIEIVPVSALKSKNIEYLESLIVSRLPFGLPQFPDDQLTDQSMQFITAEIIREKLFRLLAQELPYSITVVVDHYQKDADLTRISATIWVERKSQKAIVIGRQGAQLKKIGSLARIDIERLVDSSVYLQLWVKMREDWADDERALSAFGYSNANQSG